MTQSREFTALEGMALLAAATAVIAYPEHGAQAKELLPTLEDAGRKLAAMMGQDWERVKDAAAQEAAGRAVDSDRGDDYPEGYWDRR